MFEPPLGYDDPTLIPRKRLILLIGRMEDELNRVQKVFKDHVRGDLHSDITKDYWALRHSADELGLNYSNLVEDWIRKYENFRTSPSQEDLGALFQEIEGLKTLLMAK
jgi:hypothetical protein